MRARPLRTLMRWIPLTALFVVAVLLISQSGPRSVAPSPPLPLSRPRPPVPTTDRFAVPVLMYHRISDLTEAEARSPLMRDLTVAPSEFERQMVTLVDQGFTLLLAREVEAAVRDGGRLPEKAVAVTMDDGYKDNFECAFPILRRYGLPATIFLVTNSIGRPARLTWDDVLLMQRERIGYGSHTVTHPDLTLLPLARLDYELKESRRVLEERLVERVTAVAYPAGRYNRRVAARAEAAGYLAGWKKGGGPVQPGHDPYFLPRIRVRGCTTLEDFVRKVNTGLAVRQASARRRRSRA